MRVPENGIVEEAFRGILMIDCLLCDEIFADILLYRHGNLKMFTPLYI